MAQVFRGHMPRPVIRRRREGSNSERYRLASVGKVSDLGPFCNVLMLDKQKPKYISIANVWVRWLASLQQIMTYGQFR